jgi:hypothetical protein
MKRTPDQNATHETAVTPPESAELRLKRLGVDPSRAAIHRLGWPKQLLWRGYPPWVRLMIMGFGLWAVIVPIEAMGWKLPALARTITSLIIGLLILTSACDALVTATERVAARQKWDHYVAGTLAEIVSTIPELVVICFIIPVSPLTAMVIALVTIYNNALVFSVYSYFLPKNHKGRFIMPKAVTEVGTQILIAGAGLGSVIGLIMLVLMTSEKNKQSFSAPDLGVLATIMLTIFGIYIYMLIKEYASDEEEVCKALQLNSSQIKERIERTYDQVKRTSIANIVWLFVTGIGAAFIGGERVSEFAQTAIQELDVNPIAAAIILAAFAGMSEYVMLWRAHRKQQYNIALANAFGGITQVMFFVLPFTLLAIAIYQGVFGASHPELPLAFSVSNVLLFALLFPNFYVLIALIEEDHTLGTLDTAIMASIFLLTILILIAYGGT